MAVRGGITLDRHQTSGLESNLEVRELVLKPLFLLTFDRYIHELETKGGAGTLEDFKHFLASNYNKELAYAQDRLWNYLISQYWKEAVKTENAA